MWVRLADIFSLCPPSSYKCNESMLETLFSTKMVFKQTYSEVFYIPHRDIHLSFILRYKSSSTLTFKTSSSLFHYFHLCLCDSCHERSQRCKKTFIQFFKKSLSWWKGLSGCHIIFIFHIVLFSIDKCQNGDNASNENNKIQVCAEKWQRHKRAFFNQQRNDTGIKRSTKGWINLISDQEICFFK